MSDKNHHSEPNAFKVTEHLWIEMPDGVRLSARIWWPEGDGPFPSILEYIPYRKRDMVRARDERNHPFFASHGYVCLRVDMRGSGDSEGHMPDMYSDDELTDARHVIDWIAAQSWCTGRVGMFGTSWGGTAALQAAVDAPGPLKAIVANCATINRFDDDIHWMGGCLLTDSFEWGATLPAILASPPDFATVGKEWFDLWKKRLHKLTFPLNEWIQNSIRGEYWRHGSVVFSSKQLSCPILAIGGWSDRYSNMVMDLVKLRPDICWGIVGAWGHHYPDQGEPGPAISFQDLSLEWWNHWLKNDSGKDLDWPRLRVWQREFDLPQDRLRKRNGKWIEIDNFEQSDFTKLCLECDKLTDQPSAEIQFFDVPNNLRHGECAGDTGYFGRVGGLPLNQRIDDERALCFDSEPLAQDLILNGHAELSIDVIRDKRDAQLICRLCEVSRDGDSNLVNRQILNLALDESLDKISHFSPGKPIRYRIQLPSTAYRFTRGNRIRLAFGTSYWPLVWATTQPACIRISSERSSLKLPRFVSGTELLTPFPSAKKLPIQPSWVFESEGELQRERKELGAGQFEYSWKMPQCTFRFSDEEIAISFETSMHYRAVRNEAVSLSCTVEHKIKIFRSDGIARIESSLNSEAKDTGLSAHVNLSAVWNDEEITTITRHFNYPTNACK